MTLTAEEYIALVEKSQLIDQALLQSWLARQRCRAGHFPVDAETVARRLVEAELLTAWQARKLLQGRYKGFFLGRYKLLDQIGVGGMSRVYLAEHLLLRQRRAVKVLDWKRLRRPGQLERFQIEAQATAALEHPHIVRAYDFDRAGDICYLVTEYVPGKDLQRLVEERGPLDLPTAVDYIAQAARTLHYAHQHGFVHRDVKPANLMVDPRGQIKVLDLGLVLMPDCPEARSLDERDRVVGTADYLPPEQSVHSGLVDHRADIYGLGCTLYFLLTGRPPFPFGSPAQRVAAHRMHSPTPLRHLRADCPVELARICDRMMEKDPERRYRSAGDVACILERWLERAGERLPVAQRAAVNPYYGEPSDARVCSTRRPGTSAARSRAIGPSADTVAGHCQDTLVELPLPKSGPRRRRNVLGDVLRWCFFAMILLASCGLLAYSVPWLFP